jgi:MoaA/NifB/PqqE/SkfB family radical SAM enzyme
MTEQKRSTDAVKDKAYGKIMPYVKEIENGTIKAPISLHILITDFCVNVCNMCTHWQTENKKIMPMETLQKIWTEMNDNNGESICLTGGDPVRHPKFNDILAMERKFDLGFVNTGNYNKKNFDWELLHGVKWIRYSIDSLDNDRYKIIRSRNNLWDEVIPNIRRSKNYVKEIGINFTIQNINAHEIKNMIKFCVDEGLYRLIMYPMHGDAVLGLTKEQEHQLLRDLEETQDLWEQIPENNARFLIDNLKKSTEEEEKDVRDLAFNLEAHPCMINKIHLSIGPDGNIFPCEVIADDTSAYAQRNMWVNYIHDENNNYKELKTKKVIHGLGNVNDESMLEVWKRNYNNSFRADKCERCWARYQPIIQAYHNTRGRKTFI